MRSIVMLALLVALTTGCATTAPDPIVRTEVLEVPTRTYIKLDADLSKTLQKIERLVNDTELQKTSRGLIFLGPPGTGKTMTGKILMSKVKSTFIWVSPKDFQDISEVRGLSLAFSMARELAPTVLFIEVGLAASAVALMVTLMTK